jgi:hypothetical protein
MVVYYRGEVIYVGRQVVDGYRGGAKSVTYDAAILAGLREITDPEDLAGIYYPAHEEVRQVPERWNMSKGRKLVKHSADHAAIIQDAKIYGSPRVKIEEEEANSGS